MLGIFLQFLCWVCANIKTDGWKLIHAVRDYVIKQGGCVLWVNDEASFGATCGLFKYEWNTIFSNPAIRFLVEPGIIVTDVSRPVRT